METNGESHQSLEELQRVNEEPRRTIQEKPRQRYAANMFEKGW